MIKKANITDELIKKYKNGDLSVRDQIIQYNLYLVVLCARKYNSLGYPEEELIQIGNESLIIALENYSVESKISFATYATNMISAKMKRAIGNYILIKEQEEKNQQIQYSGFEYDKEDKSLNMLDSLIHPENVIEEKNNDIFYKKIAGYIFNAKVFSELEKNILKFRYGFFGKKYTYEEIAELAQMSRQNIIRMEKSILIRARKVLLLHGIKDLTGIQSDRIIQEEIEGDRIIQEDGKTKEYIMHFYL